MKAINYSTLSALISDNAGNRILVDTSLGLLAVSPEDVQRRLNTRIQYGVDGTTETVKVDFGGGKHDDIYIWNM